MKIYIICPVRERTKEQERKINEYVEYLEREGHQVCLPYRDTDQNDEIGLRIVEEHERDIIWADEIHIWWSSNSRGSLFDFAQARMAKKFMPEKKIIVVNVDEIEITDHKSYTNVLLATHFGLTPEAKLSDLRKAK